MKSKKMIKLYSFLLLIVILTMSMLYRIGLLSQTTALRDYPEIKASGVLHMVTDYNPSGYYISGDTIAGFQYELSKAISEISGIEVRIHLDMSLSESLTALNENKYDVIARNIPVSGQIRDNYLFTDPIVLNRQVLIQRTPQANNNIQPIRNQLDLSGKTVYISKDSPAKLRLQNLASEIGDTIYVVEEALYSDEQLAMMVAKGDIDYAVCDRQTAWHSKAQLPEIDIDTDISFTQLQSWIIRKNAYQLKDSLNSWLQQIKESGRYKKIYIKYYHDEI